MNTFFNLPLALFGMGTTEMLLVLAIVVLLFGAKKLPELAKGMGKSIKEFKKASSEDSDDEDESSEKKSVAKRDKSQGSN